MHRSLSKADRKLRASYLRQVNKSSLQSGKKSHRSLYDLESGISASIDRDVSGAPCA